MMLVEEYCRSKWAHESCYDLNCRRDVVFNMTYQKHTVNSDLLVLDFLRK